MEDLEIPRQQSLKECTLELMKSLPPEGIAVHITSASAYKDILDSD